MEVIKMAKLKKFEKSILSVEDYIKLGKDYDELSAQIKELTARKNELSAKIKEGAEKFGVKDDKGSFYLESDEFILGKVCRKSMKLNQSKAKDTLESLGVGDVIDEVTTYTVNEDRLNQAVQDGRVSIDTVRSFTDVKVDYSVSVKVKESMPEVEQSSLMAAKRK